MRLRLVRSRNSHVLFATNGKVSSRACEYFDELPGASVANSTCEHFCKVRYLLPEFYISERVARTHFDIVKIISFREVWRDTFSIRNVQNCRINAPFTINGVFIQQF